MSTSQNPPADPEFHQRLINARIYGVYRLGSLDDPTGIEHWYFWVDNDADAIVIRRDTSNNLQSISVLTKDGTTTTYPDIDLAIGGLQSYNLSLLI